MADTVSSGLKQDNGISQEQTASIPPIALSSDDIVQKRLARGNESSWQWVCCLVDWSCRYSNCKQALTRSYLLFFVSSPSAMLAAFHMHAPPSFFRILRLLLCFSFFSFSSFWLNFSISQLGVTAFEIWGPVGAHTYSNERGTAAPAQVLGWAVQLWWC